VRPEQDRRCLACHLTPQTPDSPEIAAFEGVGCESCHGPSRDWREQHYLAAWKNTRRAAGFRDLRDLTIRARSCVACHVGAPGQEVNHDLIAAGHPPLRFELSAYHEQLPKHWDEAFPLPGAPGVQSEATLWLAGQIESSRAALELLNHRTTDGVWPEFAEYDCESCHHPLASPTWRQASKGKPLWCTWYFSPRMMEVAHLLLGEDFAAQTIGEQLVALRQEMERLTASKEEIRPLVQELLSAWRPPTAATRPTQNYNEVLQLLSQPVTSAADRTWSSAAQCWLVLAILNAPRPRTIYHPQKDTEREEFLRRLRSELANPAQFDPKTWESLQRQIPD
jgi:hypothetical protein